MGSAERANPTELGAAAGALAGGAEANARAGVIAVNSRYTTPTLAVTRLAQCTEM